MVTPADVSPLVDSVNAEDQDDGESQADDLNAAASQLGNPSGNTEGQPTSTAPSGSSPTASSEPRLSGRFARPGSAFLRPTNPTAQPVVSLSRLEPLVQR